MRTVFILLFLLGKQVAQGAVQSDNSEGENCNDQNINVLSFVNPDPGSVKESLVDVQSHAVLKNHPGTAMPLSFTICSDIMTVYSTKENRLMFFSLLGNDGDHLLRAIMTGELLRTDVTASGQIPTVFPNQWVRSCMAVDTVSGMIQWVVDGKLVDNRTLGVLKDSKLPKDLNGKIILGATQLQTKQWWVFSNKLTNLNIFASLLPLSVMQRRTKGDDICLEEGDYFAWSEMQWDLSEGAFMEKINQEELKTKPLLNLYMAPFTKEDCTHFCENLGTQMPSVSNTKKLGTLQNFCEKKMKQISDLTWLAVDDNEEEGDENNNDDNKHDDNDIVGHWAL